MFGYDGDDLARDRDSLQAYFAEQRRESCDYRHVARRRRQRRAERFMQSGVRVTWSGGQRLVVAFSPTRISRIGQRWSKKS